MTGSSGITSTYLLLCLTHIWMSEYLISAARYMVGATCLLPERTRVIVSHTVTHRYCLVTKDPLAPSPLRVSSRRL